MEAQFTSASKKDRKKVTIRLAQFDDQVENDGVPRSLLTKDSVILVTIKGHRKQHLVAFTPNRFNDGEAVSATTNSWPRELPLPKTGKAVALQVLGVSYV